MINRSAQHESVFFKHVEWRKGRKSFVRSGIWTHAHYCGPEFAALDQSKFPLESGALDRSAILTYHAGIIIYI